MLNFISTILSHPRMKDGSILTVKTVADTLEPQVKIEFEIPQEPLDDFRVKPEPIQSLN